MQPSASDNDKLWRSLGRHLGSEGRMCFLFFQHLSRSASRHELVWARAMSLATFEVYSGQIMRRVRRVDGSEHRGTVTKLPGRSRRRDIKRKLNRKYVNQWRGFINGWKVRKAAVAGLQFVVDYIPIEGRTVDEQGEPTWKAYLVMAYERHTQTLFHVVTSRPARRTWFDRIWTMLHDARKQVINDHMMAENTQATVLIAGDHRKGNLAQEVCDQFNDCVGRGQRVSAGRYGIRQVTISSSIWSAAKHPVWKQFTKWTMPQSTRREFADHIASFATTTSKELCRAHDRAKKKGSPPQWLDLHKLA
jgi:hypothetical protein